MSYYHTSSDWPLLQLSVIGPDVPAGFRNYLYDTETGQVVRNANMKVVFGPNYSFVAWDMTSIQWSNIPYGLERWISSELGPTGWYHGPPRLIALGADNAYLAVTTKGIWTHFFPDTWPQLKKNQNIAPFINDCKTDKILVSSPKKDRIDPY